MTKNNIMIYSVLAFLVPTIPNLVHSDDFNDSKRHSRHSIINSPVGNVYATNRSIDCSAGIDFKEAGTIEFRRNREFFYQANGVQRDNNLGVLTEYSIECAGPFNLKRFNIGTKIIMQENCSGEVDGIPFSFSRDVTPKSFTVCDATAKTCLFSDSSAAVETVTFNGVDFQRTCRALGTRIKIGKIRKEN